MTMLTLMEIQTRAWKTAEEKGHHENLKTLPIREATMIRLALVHTEVSEAIQEIKRHGVHAGNHDVIGEELADVLIRIADLAEELQIDLASQVNRKLTENQRRPYKYGTPDERTTLCP
jgi:NTP pyrophosphatase (non-canonical NTP hydrolase)